MHMSATVVHQWTKIYWQWISKSRRIGKFLWMDGSSCNPKWSIWSYLIRSRFFSADRSVWNLSLRQVLQFLIKQWTTSYSESSYIFDVFVWQWPESSSVPQLKCSCNRWIRRVWNITTQLVINVKPIISWHAPETLVFSWVVVVRWHCYAWCAEFLFFSTSRPVDSGRFLISSRSYFRRGGFLEQNRMELLEYFNSLIDQSSLRSSCNPIALCLTLNWQTYPSELSSLHTVDDFDWQWEELPAPKAG